MSLNARTKLLAGAAAIAMSGAALANTNLDGTSVGDLFLNIVNTTNNTSFLFDTGVSQASFNGAGPYSYNLAADPNYVSFVAAGGTLDYSVISATNIGTTNQTKDTIYFTSTIAPPAADLGHSSQAPAQTSISSFLSLANTVTSSTANSALLGFNAASATNFYWGAPLTEGSVSGQLLGIGLAPYADSTTPGSALAFYSENGNNMTTFAGTWDLNGALLTYTAGSTGTGTPPPPPPAVPLPTPVLLLLSGLACMGVVARRKKAA